MFTVDVKQQYNIQQQHTEIIDSGLLIVNDMGRAKQYCLFLSVLVIYVCLKREKNLTLKTCAPDFSARLMTKLYTKIKGARAISLFDFPKTWQVWDSATVIFWMSPFVILGVLLLLYFSWKIL